ncbi:unnamed protein product [Sympodiomycopsis kandeliae]
MASAASQASTPARDRTKGRIERDRLRDYYGLGSTGNSQGSSSSQQATQGPSSTFSESVDSSYKTLINRNQSVSALLKAQSDLLTEIRELDGDRQSLVYNHHTDLVEASEMIRKMKAHSDSLAPTLGDLSSSFESIAKLSDQLKTSLQPAFSPPLAPQPENAAGQYPNTVTKSDLNVQRDLIPIVTLPQRLRDIIALGWDTETGERSTSAEEQGLPAAEALWGRHESILSSWAKAEVPGAADIAAECRATLREERERRRAPGNSGP